MRSKSAYKYFKILPLFSFYMYPNPKHDYREKIWDYKYQEWKTQIPQNKVKKPAKGIRTFYESPFRKPSIIIGNAEIKQKLPSPKIKIPLAILAYLIPLIILVAILIYIFQPFGFEGKTYTIEVGKSGDTNDNKAFYLDEKTIKSALSFPKEEENLKFREVTSQRPFNLIFKPDIEIPESAKKTLQLEFIGKNSDIYLNDQLVFPGLANYSILRDYDNEILYVIDDIIPYLPEKNEENINKAKDFLLANFPGTAVYSTIPIELEAPEIDGYQKTETEINTTFRGPLNLAVYGENLNIKFTKHDLNWYTGNDTYTLTVKDINKNIIFHQTYEDDGNELNNSVKGNNQDFEINLKNARGVYFIQFLIDKNNKAVDTTLTKLQFSTNKVMILGDFLPWHPITIYTENIIPKQIAFNYWWGSKFQRILITGPDIIKIDLNESYRSIRYPYTLEP